MYTLKKCSKKEWCKQCRHVKYKGTMTKWPLHKTNTQNNAKTGRTSIRNRHLQEKNYILYTCAFLTIDYS